MKLFVTWQSLLCRNRNPGLFSEGEYIPPTVVGPRKEHVFAFLRRHGERRALVVVPRLICELLEGRERLPLGAEVWKETRVQIPEPHRGGGFRDLFTGKTFSFAGEYAIGEVLAAFPVSLLIEEGIAAGTISDKAP